MPEQQDSIPMVPQSTFMSMLPSSLFMMRLQIGLQVLLASRYAGHQTSAHPIYRQVETY